MYKFQPYLGVEPFYCSCMGKGYCVLQTQHFCVLCLEAIDQSTLVVSTLVLHTYPAVVQQKLNPTKQDKMAGHRSQFLVGGLE